MEAADLILLVSDDAVDLGRPRPQAYWEEYRQLLGAVGGQGTPWIFIASKRDLSGKAAGSIGALGGTAWNGPSAYVSLSARTGEGLEDLERAVAGLFPAGASEEAGSLLTDQRQEETALRAREAVRRAREALEGGLTPDAVLTDAEEALDALGELTGRTAREEIVERIFSRFCVGK